MMAVTWQRIHTGADIKAVRARFGWRQTELAERLGITPTYLSLMENGRREIERRTALAIVYLQNEAQGLSVKFRDGQPTVVFEPA